MKKLIESAFPTTQTMLVFLHPNVEIPYRFALRFCAVSVGHFA